jgi:hypothetical protein
MAAAQARQKSYADKRWKPIEFEVGDHVYLKVSLMRGVKHFGIKRNLEPRYVRPYRIIKKSGRVAYKLNLPHELGAIFLVFHVSQLKKCLRLPEERVAVRRIKSKSDLSYKEKPIYVLDTQERVTHSRVVKLYKVVWSNHGERDAIWEREDDLKENHSAFYINGMPSKSWDEIFIRGRAATPQVFGLHLCICIASHEHIHPIITCASSYVSMLQHDVSLVLVYVCIICDVSVLCLVP